MIPLFASSLTPYHDRLSGALERVARSGRYILGPEVEAFEEEFARYLGVRHCVGVANGTDALTIALRALGVGPGDEVVMPSFTFYATAEAAIVLGARPVFCDIDLDTFCVTADTVRAALTPRTKAIVPVDLFGNTAPSPVLRELGVPDDLFPPTIGDLERYERDMLETAVVPNVTSRLVARPVLHPFAALPAAVYWPTDVIAAGLLPPPLREAFELRWGNAERFFFRFVIHALRIWRAFAPRWLAIVPHARLYDRRVR